MRGHAHQVDGQCRHVDGNATGGLGCINVQQNAFFAAQCTNGRDVLDHADFVVDEQHADQDGVRANGSLEQLHIEQTVFFHIKIGDFEALALQLAHGVQHGLVLGLERDQVLALALVELGSTLERQVDGFGCATRPDDFARIGVDEIGHLHTRLFNGLFGLPTPGVAAGCGIAEVLTQPRNHGIDHARIDRRCCAVIKVNGKVWGHIHGWLNQKVLACTSGRNYDVERALTALHRQA